MRFGQIHHSESNSIFRVLRKFRGDLSGDFSGQGLGMNDQWKT